MAKLTPLPYPYHALEPTISGQTVRLHHDTHQAGYVKGWNKGLEATPSSRDDYEDLAFNGAGIILHELYWENLCPLGRSVPPSNPLGMCVARCFGSFETMVQQMADVGASIQGSGWVVLAWIPRFARMLILPISNHEDGWIPGAVPLLVIDVWEHAYYLDYQAARAEYLKLIWHNVNWAVVSRRYHEAT